MATAILQQQADRLDGAVRPKVRRAVAVLVSRFPLITETFILREIIEMERQGQPVVLVPLLRERPAVMHREAEPWVEKALYTPFLSGSILAANLYALCRYPLRYAGVLAQTLLGSARSPHVLLRSLALFPKSVYLAWRLYDAGVRHVHAHFATHPAATALIISRLTGISFSFTVHAHDIFVPWRRPLLREKIRRARFVRAISQMNRAYLLARYPDVARQKVDVIHVGIEPDRYDTHSRTFVDPTRGGGSDPSGDGRPRLLCVAAFKPYKGLPVLLEACQRLKDDGVSFRCDIVGHGPMQSEIERLRGEKGLEGFVQLLGPRTQDEVAAMMANASMFVLPSIIAPDGQMEGIPVALMEAMAAGRPVIASAVSGITELVEDGLSGVLVRPGDARGIDAAIQQLIADPLRARRMGQRGREAIERGFRLDACVSTLLDRLDRHNEPPGPELEDRHVEVTRAMFPRSAIGIRQIRERHDSTVLQLLVSEGGPAQDRIVKVHRPLSGARRSAADRARCEFDALQVLSREFGRPVGGHTDGIRPREQPRLGVPRPVVLHERAAAIAMEPCSGRSLVHLIREARMSCDPQRKRLLRSALYQTGRWLRSFQCGSKPLGDTSAALDALLIQAREDLDTCSGRDLAPELAARTRTLLGELRAASRAASLASTRCHCDFGPGNVYYGDGNVQVIDFEGFRNGFPYEDVAYFLVQLQIFFAYPFLGSQFGRLAFAFLDGYRGNDLIDPSAYTLCRVANALHLLARSDNHAGRTGLSEWRRRRTLRSIVRGD